MRISNQKAVAVFTVEILKGACKGMILEDQRLYHVDEKHAWAWVAGVEANCKEWKLLSVGVYTLEAE